MSDELKCPRCGNCLQAFGKTEFYVMHCCERPAFNDSCYCRITVTTKEYKTKQGAINAARRLLAKMKGGE